MANVEIMKLRAKRCVCKYCGSALELKRIMFHNVEDARVELYCSSCGRLEFGTEPQIYQSASYFVKAMEFQVYPGLDDNEQTQQMNIAKVCEIMAWENKQLGYLDETGFLVPSVPKLMYMGQTVIYEDDDLKDYMEGVL